MDSTNVVYGEVAGTEVIESVAHTELYEIMRQKYEQYMRVTCEDLGLASVQQTQELAEWVESIAPSDEQEIHEALKFYDLDYSKKLSSALKLHEKFYKELSRAHHDNVITQESFDEWMRWIRDPCCDYKEKEESVLGEKPEGFKRYLAERRALAKERTTLLKHKYLDAVTTPRLQKEIEFLRDDKEWFGTLSFTQRKNLLDRITAGLKVEKGGEKYKVLFAKAEEILLQATYVPQPALHRDKVGTWLKRIFESGATPAQIDVFITGNGSMDGKTLPQLIDTWRKVAIEFWKTRQDSAFEGIQINCTNTKGFLWMHYDERVVYIEKLKAQRNRAHTLKSQAHARVDVPYKTAWLKEHLFNGTHTLEELESIINGDLAERLEPLKDYMEGKEEQEKEGHEGRVRVHTEQQDAAGQIDALVDTLPADMKGMAIAFAELGSEAVNAWGWGDYNRSWCHQHGYLDAEREHHAIAQGKHQALAKERSKRKGVVNETIQGTTGQEEYIELSRTSATNVCLDIADSGAKSAFVETVRRTHSDNRAWYWTNLIYHRGGHLMQLSEQQLYTKKIYRMRNLLKNLEKGGQQYRYTSSAVDLSLRTVA